MWRLKCLCVWGLLLTWSATAQASFHIYEPDVLGFTADGSTFVYVEKDSQTLRDDDEAAAIRIDMATRQEQRYSYKKGNDTEGPDLERIAFQKWRKKNPTKCLGGPRSPDGNYSLRMLLKSADGIRGRWERQAYSFQEKDEAPGEGTRWATLRILLEQQRKTLQIDKWATRADWRMEAVVIPCWSPDGKSLALVSFRNGVGMRDEGEVGVKVFSLGSELKWEFPPLRQ